MTTDETIQLIEGLSSDDRWAIGQALEILYFAGKTERQCKAVNNLLDLADLACFKFNKAEAELKLYREFVGAMSIIDNKNDGWYGGWQYFITGDVFVICDAMTDVVVATGTDPFDAWRNLRNQELSEVESKDA